MNAAAAKQTIKQHFQTLTDEQLKQYHLTHDYFSGRPLSEQQIANRREPEVDAALIKKQRNLTTLNEILYPMPTLGSVLGDSLAALKLTFDKPETPDSHPLEKPSEDLVNRAKNWFDQFQQEDLETLLQAQSRQLSEANIAVVKREFSRNTILIQNVCMLSAFWIRSPLEWDATDDKGLFEHLFVQYEAPTFLKTCWSQVADEDNVRWLLCFVLYAQGGSLKALANHVGWTTVSSKLWHQLYRCPVNVSPLHAVLYAEFKRLGGWAEDYTCLMANESYVIDLLDPISEEGRDFWYDTCRWTISKQYELSAEENSKVLWWARHQLTEHARHGESYRLQGRSLAKVRESIADYEHKQAQIARDRARLAERGRQVSMARNEARDRLREQECLEREFRRNARYDYDYDDLSWNRRNWDWVTIAHGKHWTIVELVTSQALTKEGAEMFHCVGSYAESCFQGQSAIFSLKCEGYRKVTIEIDPLTREVIQMQRAYNAEPKRAEQSVVNAWINRVVKHH